MSARPSPFAASRQGVSVAVRLTPKAAANRIGPLAETADGGAALKVAVTAAPEHGKANAALLALLAKTWRLPKSALSIAAGASDRRKRIHIAGDSAVLLPMLETWLETWLERQHG
jgi:uncharacterized protein YggU (UPF0235/DUF167 family)